MASQVESQPDGQESCASSPSGVSITEDAPNFSIRRPQNSSEESSSAFTSPLTRTDHFQNNEHNFPAHFPSSLMMSTNADRFLSSQWRSQQALSPSACDEFQEQFETNTNYLNNEEDQNGEFFLTLPTKHREYYFIDSPSSSQQHVSTSDTEVVASPKKSKKQYNRSSSLSPRQYSNCEERTEEYGDVHDSSSRIDTLPTTITNTISTRLTTPRLREHRKPFLKPRVQYGDGEKSNRKSR